MECKHQIAHINTAPLPDEHLVGMLGRHHMFSGFRTYKKALSEISADVTRQYPSAVDRPLYLDLFNQLGSGETYHGFLCAFCFM